MTLTRKDHQPFLIISPSVLQGRSYEGHTDTAPSVPDRLLFVLSRFRPDGVTLWLPAVSCSRGALTIAAFVYANSSSFRAIPTLRGFSNHAGDKSVILFGYIDVVQDLERFADVRKREDRMHIEHRSPQQQKGYIHEGGGRGHGTEVDSGHLDSGSTLYATSQNAAGMEEILSH